MRRTRAGLAAAATLVAAGLAGCGGPAEPPIWVDLARAKGCFGLPLGTVTSTGERIERMGADGRELWLVSVLERAAWTALPEPGRFRALLPVLAVGSPREGAPYRLLGGEREFVYEADPARFGDEPGEFATQVAQALGLELALAPGEEPPERAELWACIDCESSDGGVARVGGRRLSGAGIWVPPGRPRGLNLAIPPDACLRFATSVEPLLAAREPRLAPRTFRVRLDDVVVFEWVAEVDVLGEALAWHVVPLPAGGVQRAKLQFEVQGPFALTCFLAPSVGPREAGSYGERPFAAERPDLIVFLADTFRADNLSAYGQELGLTPEIDRLAREARVFARAWSTSTHTLPAHSSMFSGVYPHQNGQVDDANPLPAAVETLAELLSAQGYRTGAITDGVMLTESHGLAQGFDTFDARRDTGTRARVQGFLDADDGRPIFLFVQSYAAHAPYALSAETRARFGGELQLDHTFDEVYGDEALRRFADSPPGPETPPADARTAEVAARLHDLYRAGAVELDALFGSFRTDLETRGLLGRAHLLFTSDHGEAFFEHGRPFHANRVYEEELRVPLFLHGPEIGAGRVQHPVSLIDFGPTLCALAGVPVPAHWRGRSLLDPDPARVIYAFQSNRGSGREASTLAVIDGTRKLIGYDELAEVQEGKLHAAFDLASDPLERASVLGGEAWPAELERAHRAVLVELLTPLVTAETKYLTTEEFLELQRLGYGGASDEEDADAAPADPPRSSPAAPGSR